MCQKTLSPNITGREEELMVNKGKPKIKDGKRAIHATREPKIKIVLNRIRLHCICNHSFSSSEELRTPSSYAFILDGVTFSF